MMENAHNGPESSRDLNNFSDERDQHFKASKNYLESAEDAMEVSLWSK